ncbi:hypothetical protein LCGC14_0916110 [marine sediment metagenome]|uniref:Uncharacterized protein n=1 Tax=marine sediment metagenome TaxID=412755 RepID=A0A0F9NS84_9ZZZZ
MPNGKIEKCIRCEYDCICDENGLCEECYMDLLAKAENLTEPEDA